MTPFEEEQLEELRQVFEKYYGGILETGLLTSAVAWHSKWLLHALQAQKQEIIKEIKKLQPQGEQEYYMYHKILNIIDKK